jgi:heavy metal efflux system protein
MRRTEQTADMIPKVKDEIDKLNHDGSLPQGVKVVPYYDRSSLIAITTHTVLHNLIFGCLLVFLIQWIFLGNLRSAVIVGLNIPFALFFATILLVILGESANLLSVGAVDFGIIVDSAVILVENIFRNFQRNQEERQGLLQRLSAGAWGPDPTRILEHEASANGWTDRLRLILISALQERHTYNKARAKSRLIGWIVRIPRRRLQTQWESAKSEAKRRIGTRTRQQRFLRGETRSMRI